MTVLDIWVKLCLMSTYIAILISENCELILFTHSLSELGDPELQKMCIFGVRTFKNMVELKMCSLVQIPSDHGDTVRRQQMLARERRGCRRNQACLHLDTKAVVALQIRLPEPYENGFLLLKPPHLSCSVQSIHKLL